MKSTEAFVSSVLRRAPWALVEPGVARLCPEAEARCLADLQAWRERVQTLKERHEAGDKTLRDAGQGSLLTAIELAQQDLLPREERAQLGLYAGMVAALVKIAERMARGAGVDVDDVLSETWLALLYAVASYDPDQGTALSTWVHHAGRRPLYRAVQALSAPDDVIPFDDVPADPGIPFEPESHDPALDPVYDSELRELAGELAERLLERGVVTPRAAVAQLKHLASACRACSIRVRGCRARAARASQ